MTAAPIARHLGSRTYGTDDQRWFAAASHDRNPMHVDPVAARRLLSGRQVVHGIHALLTGLDLWLGDADHAVAAVQCDFSSPVNVGDRVDFNAREDAPGRTTIMVSNGDLGCIHLVVDANPAGGASVAEEGTGQVEMIDVPPLDAPMAKPASEHVGARYRLRAGDAEQLARAFPNAAKHLGKQRLASIAALSQFVGMVCPGQHSVFSSVRFDIAEAPASDSPIYLVRRYDDRFRLVTADFDGLVRGELRAFVRPAPQAQASMKDIALQVQPGEFAGTRSWVIGGSRGLGETVAKLVAAGQGEVVVSYAAGADDAARVAAEINHFARGRCQARKFDLKADRFDDAVTDAGALDAVYYFATPKIFRKSAATFDRAVFDDFVDFYVAQFAALCDWLEGLDSERQVSVYLPSSVAVADRPRGMTEYAMAKCAAEILAADLNRTMKRVRVVVTRLPRLATDQTATVHGAPADSAVQLLLPAVRSVLAGRIK